MILWNLGDKTLKIKTRSKEILFKINNKKATVDGKIVNIKVPAEYKNGNIFVPLRFVCDTIGASMNWDPNKRVINIHYLKPTPKTYDIKIKGDDNFIDITKKALKLLEDKDPDTYKLIKLYIGVIEQNKSSDQQSITSTMFPYEEPPRFQFNGVTVNESTTWYASAIAHNAMHSKRCRTCFNDYDGAKKIDYKKIPVDLWAGQDTEKECLKYQIKALEKIGAPDNEITFVKSFLGTDCVLFF